MSTITNRVIPICPSCGHQLGAKEVSYRNLLARGAKPSQAFEILGIDNECCRVRFLCPAVLPAGAPYNDPDYESKLKNFNYKESNSAPDGPVLLAAIPTPTGTMGLDITQHILFGANSRIDFTEKGNSVFLSELGNNKPCESKIELRTAPGEPLLSQPGAITKDVKFTDSTRVEPVLRKRFELLQDVS